MEWAEWVKLPRFPRFDYIGVNCAVCVAHVWALGNPIDGLAFWTHFRVQTLHLDLKSKDSITTKRAKLHIAKRIKSSIGDLVNEMHDNVNHNF